jgi:hypothetical protein
MPNQEHDPHVIAAIAAVIPDSIQPLCPGEEPRESLAIDLASSWVAQGFADPQQVAAWIKVGVLSPQKARKAEYFGFRPGDPWVGTGWGTDLLLYAPEYTKYLRRDAPPLSGTEKWQHRRAAKREWRKRQQQIERRKAQFVHVVGVLEQLGDETGDAAWSAHALSFGEMAGTDPAPETVLRVFSKFVAQAHTIRELALFAQERLGEVDMPVALHDETERRGMRNHDNYFYDVSTSPLEWLRSEITDWFSYLEYLDDQLESARSGLRVLEPREAETAAAETAAALEESERAREVWRAIRRFYF